MIFIKTLLLTFILIRSSLQYACGVPGCIECDDQGLCLRCNGNGIMGVNSFGHCQCLNPNNIITAFSDRGKRVSDCFSLYKIPGCIAVNGQQDCILCKDPAAQLVDGRCSCPSRQKFNGLKMCISCQVGCESCSGTAICEKCIDQQGTLIIDGRCLCTITGYDFNSRGYCSPTFDIGCKETLPDLFLGCHKCKDSNAVIEESFITRTFLVCQCPDGQSMNYQGLCQSCQDVQCAAERCSIPGCQQCESGTSGSACAIASSSSAYIMEDGTVACRFEGYKLDEQGQCKFCNNIGCRVCHSTTQECLVCISERASIIEGHCQCPEGFTLTHQGLCQANALGNLGDSCSENCETCRSTSPSSCLSCKDPKAYLYHDKCECRKTVTYDLGFLGTGFIPNQFNIDGECELCKVAGCASCVTGNPNQCRRCLSQSANLQNGQCICQSGQYMNPQGECSNCTVPGCITCSSSDPNYCIECSHLQMIRQNGQCLCKLQFLQYGYHLGFFRREMYIKPDIYGQCLFCYRVGCRTCSQNGCHTCIDPRAVVVDGTCECPSGQQMASTGYCSSQPIPIGCASYQNGVCLECIDTQNTYIENGLCLCAIGQMRQFGYCEYSPLISFDECLAASDTYCHKCIDPTAQLVSILVGPQGFQNYLYVCQCPQGFKFNDGLCVEQSVETCDLGCKVCSPDDLSVCLECVDKDHAVLIDGVCSCRSLYRRLWPEVYDRGMCLLCDYEEGNICDQSVSNQCQVAYCVSCTGLVCHECQEGYRLIDYYGEATECQPYLIGIDNIQGSSSLSFDSLDGCLQEDIYQQYRGCSVCTDVRATPAQGQCTCPAGQSITCGGLCRVPNQDYDSGKTVFGSDGSCQCQEEGSKPNPEGLCEPCNVFGCASCNIGDPQSCHLCNEGVVLIGEKCYCYFGFNEDGFCLAYPPGGSYTTVNDLDCLQKFPGCSLCTSDLSECVMCTSYGTLALDQDVMVLSSGSCRCLTDSYKISSTQICTFCDIPGCESCVDWVGNGFSHVLADNLICWKCIDPSAELIGNVCVCPQGQIIVEGICQQCTAPGCAECVDGNHTRCLSCIDTEKAVVNESGACSCPENYSMSSSWICYSCDVLGCRECQDGNSERCRQCEDQNSLRTEEGLCECPNTQQMDSNGFCFTCEVLGCEQCQDSNGFKCQVCIDSSANLTDEGSCQCLDGKSMSSQGFCFSCDVFGCEICEDGESDLCESCIDESANILEDGSCSCPEPLIMNASGNCVPCYVQGCAFCIDGDSEVCRECLDSQANIENGHCVCPEDYYLTIQGSCLECSITGCKVCQDQDSQMVCVECKDELASISEGECLCPEDHDMVDEFCRACFVLGCQICSADNPQICETCSDVLAEVEQGSCICPQGYVLSSDGFCNQCEVQFCSKCQQESTERCQECQQDYSLTSSNQCAQCNLIGCHQCDPFSNEICTNCLDDFAYLVNGSCICLQPFTLVDGYCKGNYEVDVRIVLERDYTVFTSQDELDDFLGQLAGKLGLIQGPRHRQINVKNIKGGSVVLDLSIALLSQTGKERILDKLSQEDFMSQIGTYKVKSITYSDDRCVDDCESDSSTIAIIIGASMGSALLLIVVTIVIIYLCPEPKVKPDPETQLALRKTGSETALGGDLKNQNTANTETRLKNSTSQII